MYTIYYRKDLLDKYNYLKSNPLYSKKIEEFERLVEKNPYKNEISRPYGELVSFHYVELDTNTILQYQIDEKTDSVNVYRIDIID